ncbi:MAG: NAD-dependent epimerase/dehydratase family protein [Bacteroidales bacterium]|nr:NAD-dependent epimerase/dehydratase family protein [Bacteroidales bacterium]
MSVLLNDIVREDISRILGCCDLSPLDSRDVLITGANGHIASYLAITLAEARKRGLADIRLTILSRSLPRMRESFGEYIEAGLVDVLAQDVTSPLPPALSFDYIFHFAGNASPHFIATDPIGILRANIQGAFNMADTCLRRHDSKLIFASTREVYGANLTDQVLTETSFGSLDPLDPRSCYPESKRAAESIIEAYHIQHALRYTIMRIAHVYGPGMKLSGDGRVMSDFLANAMHKEPIRLNSDGSALRSFCYITDCIRAILMAALTPEDAGIYNLSNETEEISVGDLALTIGRLAGGIEVSMKPSDPASAGLYCAYKRKPLDCSRLLSLGWKPEVLLSAGIDRTLRGSVPD